MTREPFIAHSDLTNEIYIVCGSRKYLVTEQVIKAMQNTGRLEQPSEDCVSRKAVLDTLMKYEKPCDDRQDFYLDSTTEFEEEIKELPPVTPISEKHYTQKLLNDFLKREVLRMGKCTDCNEYNKEKHYCPNFCNVIRETDKEMREYYKGEHEKLEKIEQIVNCELIARKRNYKSCYNAFYEIVDVIQDREVLEDE